MGHHTYLAVLWHMHQPYYKNLFTGEYLLPWVLLHGTKDYLDMPAMLKEFPDIRQNFNLVPSLLMQLKDYETLEVKDLFLNIFRKDPADLNEEEKRFLLANFFSAHQDNMIRPFPRYYELLRKRNSYSPADGTKGVGAYFSDAELRDIQILFYLSWVDPVFFNSFEELKNLKAKGRAFTETDKEVLQTVQRRILKEIIPTYRELASQGIVELSTSPFYHPIIPLLIDSRSASEALPGIRLPQRIFTRPQDASRQIGSALDYFNEVFGFKSVGMWPPEGSVSDAALCLYMEHGIKWLATDESILFRSSGLPGRQGEQGRPSNPDLLYRPYRFEQDGKSISIIFRDRTLSDLISFQYAGSDPKDAAIDCVRRIKAIGESLRGRSANPLVTIAMDGENAWESFTNDGRDFLKYLYEAITKDETILPTTISSYLLEVEETGSLSHVAAGSWIDHNFAIWIGHPEDNRAWDLLAETRDFLEQADPAGESPEAWESIYIAEGSDWFWWYGDEHSSDNDEVFDTLFRENLSNVYRFLGKVPPENLSIPVIMEDREIKPSQEPVSFIHPTIDGRVTNYFDWMGSGFVEGSGHGAAMHAAAAPIKCCYYGFDETMIYLRLDLDKAVIPDMNELSFDINMVGSEPIAIIYQVKTGIVDSKVPVSIAFSEVLEMAIPFTALGVKSGDKVAVWVSLKVKEMSIDRMPKRGYLPIKVPSESFETEMWSV